MPFAFLVRISVRRFVTELVAQRQQLFGRVQGPKAPGDCDLVLQTESVTAWQ